MTTPSSITANEVVGAEMPLHSIDDCMKALTECMRELLAFIKAHCPPWFEPEDILQNIGLILLQQRETIKNPNLRAWLFTVARWAAADAWRETKGEKLVFTDAIVDIEDKSFEFISANEIGKSELLTALRECLKTIKPEFAATLLMKYSGSTTQQIAEKRKIATATVYTQVSRGKDALRKCMGGKPE